VVVVVVFVVVWLVRLDRVWNSDGHFVGHFDWVRDLLLDGVWHGPLNWVWDVLLDWHRVWAVYGYLDWIVDSLFDWVRYDLLDGYMHRVWAVDRDADGHWDVFLYWVWHLLLDVYWVWLVNVHWVWTVDWNFDGHWHFLDDWVRMGYWHLDRVWFGDVHGVRLGYVYGVRAVHGYGNLDWVWVWLGHLDGVRESDALGDGLDWYVMLVRVCGVPFVTGEVGVTGAVTAGRDESVSVTGGQDVGVTVTVGGHPAETVAGVEQAPLALGLAVDGFLLGRLVVCGQTVSTERNRAHREQRRSHGCGGVQVIRITATTAIGVLGRSDWT